MIHKALVTGGGGFLGTAIVKQLLQRNTETIVLGRSSYSHLEKLGVSCLQGDICDRESVLLASQGVDVVFHVAALAGIWGRAENFYRVNVEGTRNIIQACLENDVAALVHTSSPSVVFGRSDIHMGDESMSYPRRYLCHYARTKAEAERSVLAIDQKRVKSCAIRPHLIWGPGDPHLVPRLLERGKSKQLKIVGDGSNLVDITYVDNAAGAHVLAAEELFSGEAKCAGKPYFIGQEQPVRLWDWINELFRRVGIEEIRRSLPFSAAYAIGGCMEFVYSALNLGEEPKMTRFLAEQLAKSHYFSHESAQRDFGYTPEVTLDEGMERLVHWVKENDSYM